MNKVISALLVSTAALFAGLCAGSAQAANVSWSIGINAPGIGTVISNVPAYPVQIYAPAPIYVPVPVAVYQPEYRVEYLPDYRPGYAVQPAPVAYPRYGVSYRPVPVAYWHGYGRHHWEPRRDRDDRDDRDHHHHHGDRHD